ncbi:uncharacterized protein G2W53_039506 [Senna tora]|uniref:Uncharacterized protein n=1 Tax=Senna tora TaxID=362788 RepID=A0A834SQX4_9FABA|nr:uncharacterized protein G2W53_039506 [Senna tora]
MQARRAKLELDPHDERTTKRVHSVLVQFKRGRRLMALTLVMILVGWIMIRKRRKRS